MALAHRVKKLEAQFASAGTIRCMYVFYGCDTEADIERRIAREPRETGGGINLFVTIYSCEHEGRPHSHADERFWEPGHSPRQSW